MALVLAALLAAAPAEPVSLSPPWATIRRSPALLRTQEAVEIGTVGGAWPEGIRYWMRRTVRQRSATTVGWTTTADCPGSRALIGEMELLAAGVDVPGQGWESKAIILDGVGYSLEAPARIGDGGIRFGISSNLGTPLAAFTDRLLAALAPCWKADAPGDTRFVPPLTDPQR